jgi:RNA polymerase-binding transcription factor DksA
MNEAQLRKYEKLLRTRMQELSNRLEEIEDDLDEPPDPDAEERATEREGDEVLESLGQAGLIEIKQIQAALQRMADGEYGDCITCGEPISPERLDVVPHTPFCRDCA